MALDDLAAHDAAAAPIRAFDEDVRLQPCDETLRRALVKDRDIIHAGECGNEQGSILLREDGSSGSFQILDGSVAVEGHDQHIPEALGPFQQLDVPGVHEVKASVGEDDPPASSLGLAEEAGEC
jgi:hypothetical protein